MDMTIFLTILSGVLTFVIGQVIVKLVIDPVQDLKKTIGMVSHAMVERANVISNPGVLEKEVMDATSTELRKLSSQLHAHLRLVPFYSRTSRIFGLPSDAQVRKAAEALIGLSNGLYRTSDNIYEVNAKRVENVCDSLEIYLDEGRRWPK